MDSIKAQWNEIIGGIIITVIILVIAIFIVSSISTASIDGQNTANFLKLKQAVGQAASDGSASTSLSFQSASKRNVYGVYYIHPKVAAAIIDAANNEYFSMSEESKSILNECKNRFNEACVCLFKIDLNDVKRQTITFPSSYLEDFGKVLTITQPNGMCKNEFNKQVIIKETIPHVFNVLYLNPTVANPTSIDYYTSVANYEDGLVCDFDYDNAICNTGENCITRGGCDSYIIVHPSDYCINNEKYHSPAALIHFKQIKSVEIKGCFKVATDTKCTIEPQSKPCLFMLYDSSGNHPLLWLGAKKGKKFDMGEVTIGYDKDVGLIFTLEHKGDEIDVGNVDDCNYDTRYGEYCDSIHLPFIQAYKFYTY